MSYIRFIIQANGLEIKTESWKTEEDFEGLLNPKMENGTWSLTHSILNGSRGISLPIKVVSARVNQKLAGWCFVVDKKMPGGDGKVFFGLHQIYVASEFRTSGLGKKLTDKALDEWPNTHNSPYVWTFWGGAVPLIEKHNLKPLFNTNVNEFVREEKAKKKGI